MASRSKPSTNPATASFADSMPITAAAMHVQYLFMRRLELVIMIYISSRTLRNQRGECTSACRMNYY
jgi:hypothetical protein